MKQLTEYLDRAVSLERLAADEQNPGFKAELLNQAARSVKAVIRDLAAFTLMQPLALSAAAHPSLPVNNNSTDEKAS
jgi:hypothetical protein